MNEHDNDQVQTWLTANSPLFQFVAGALPTYRTARNFLDLQRLADELKMSKEGVYKWFRMGRIPAKRARHIIEASNRPENVARLSAAGKSPPTIADFTCFL